MGHPWRLQAGVGDGDVRVDAGAGGRDGVDRHRHVVGEAVLLAVGDRPLLDRGQQVGVGGTLVGRPAGGSG